MKDDWLILRCKLIKILDQNSFPVHTLELSNPKVLIRPYQTELTKEKNVVVGEESHEKKVLQSKTPRVATEASTLGGRTRKKGPIASRPV